ncbi:organic cation transporter protein-like [Branchiostoma floridae]|uniref:Organic cation transporter protein-like n=1 Tax=Branchiostoma floridae TaxID=7739 RepID=A0A9J7MIK8_BRAFL|nr:organic cation transporter protein-like [Branchiostoma floridae]XP_035668645.1 organic cation transporter protein-like [Branchiostoma floridae]
MAEREPEDEALFEGHGNGISKDKDQGFSDSIKVNYDKALKYLGGFGPWQKRVYLLVCLPAVFNAFQTMGIVFIAAEPDFSCRQPDVNFTGLNATDAEIRNITVPWEKKGDEWKQSQCSRYSYNFTASDLETTYQDFVSRYPVANRTKIQCDQGYVYDTSQFENTVVTQWDVVCDKKWQVNMIQSVWMAGLMVGSFFGGHAADIWGRKPVLLALMAVMYLFGMASAFSPNFTVLTAFRFIMACAGMIIFEIPFVLGAEMVSPEKRTLVGMIIMIYWAVGYVLLAGVAYLIRSWMWFQIAVTMPYLIGFAYYWMIPESPRWLISRNRQSEAKAIVEEGAKVAKVNLPDEVFHDDAPLTTKEEEGGSDRALYTFVDLFRTPNLRKWTINLFFNWAVNSMVYYGISLNAAAFHGNLYLNFAISGFVEIPAYLISIYILDKFGRRCSLSSLMVVGGVACIVAFFIPKHLFWLTTTLAMIGKFCITATFAIVYIFTAEIYPTVIRQIGLGMGAMMARVGGIIAPFIDLLGVYWTPLPYVIFGGTSIAAGLLALLLPETNGIALPATIEDGENFRKKDGIVDEEKETARL